MILRVIGDVHGNTAAFSNLVNIADRDDRDVLVFQLGDMGLGFSGTILPTLDKKHRFIRGNHDGPDACRSHPNYAGDFGYDPAMKLFFLGGAWSIDWAWRLAWNETHRDPVWWADEQLSDAELSRAFDLYCDKKPELVITHEAPLQVTTALLTPMLADEAAANGYGGDRVHIENTRTSVALQKMFQAHRPKQWLFGHYHVGWNMELEDTKFTCLPELREIDIEIKESE